MSEEAFSRLAHAALVESSLEKEMQRMGDDADSVADYLIERGVEGYRYHPESCPVALWLGEASDDLGDSKVLSVDKERVRVRTPGGDLTLAPTPAVSEFVRAFDEGDFPELDAEDEEDLDDYIDDESEDHG